MKKKAKKFTPVPPSAHGQTSEQRLAKLRTWKASGQATAAQRQRYNIEIEELENAQQVAASKTLFDNLP